MQGRVVMTLRKMWKGSVYDEREGKAKKGKREERAQRSSHLETLQKAGEACKRVLWRWGGKLRGRGAN